MDSDNEDDDNVMLADVRDNQNSTAPRRKYSSLIVNNRLDLKMIRDHAISSLDTLHVIQLFLLIVGSALAIAKRYGNTRSVLKITKLLWLVLGTIAMCENELDILIDVEVGITGLWLDELPPLPVFPKKLQD